MPPIFLNMILGISEASVLQLKCASHMFQRGDGSSDRDKPALDTDTSVLSSFPLLSSGCFEGL